MLEQKQISGMERTALPFDYAWAYQIEQMLVYGL